MAPTDLRSENKFDRVKAMLWVLMLEGEREGVVRIYELLNTEEMFQISAPITASKASEPRIALNLINYYLHGGPRPDELRTLEPMWKENLL